MLALLEDCKHIITTQDDFDSVLSEFARAGFAKALARLQSHPLANSTATSQMQKLAMGAITNGEVNGLDHVLRRSTFADAILPGSLALSALHGHESMAEFLIDRGADVHEQGEMGTPLRCASAYGYNNICHILLSHGARVDENSHFGSALHAAAMRGHNHTVKLLVDYGADVNIEGGFYGTALQAASYHGHSEVVSLLLAANADVYMKGLCGDAIKADEKVAAMTLFNFLRTLGTSLGV